MIYLKAYIHKGKESVLTLFCYMGTRHVVITWFGPRENLIKRKLNPNIQQWRPVLHQLGNPQSSSGLKADTMTQVVVGSSKQSHCGCCKFSVVHVHPRFHAPYLKPLAPKNNLLGSNKMRYGS